MSLDLKQHREMIRKYHQGGLSFHEMHALEKKAMEDPFLADALEGFSEINNDHIIEELDEKIRNYGSNNTSFYSKFVLPLTIVVLMGLMLNNTNELFKKEDTTPVATKEQKVIKRKNILDDYRIISKLSGSNTIPETQWIQNLPEVKNDTKELKETSLSNTSPNPLKKLSPQAIDSNPVKKKLMKYKHPVYYVYDLKVANYKGFRSVQMESERLLNSLLAKFEYQGQSEQEMISDQKISYTDFLDDCLYYFKQHEYQKALEGFNIILKTYPDDINAKFYSGLANYNLNQANKSVHLFRDTFEHPYGVFEDASEWYLALSLYKTGQRSKSIRLLNKIEKSDSFYSEKAKKQLKQLVP